MISHYFQGHNTFPLGHLPANVRKSSISNCISAYWVPYLDSMTVVGELLQATTWLYHMAAIYWLSALVYSGIAVATWVTYFLFIRPFLSPLRKVTFTDKSLTKYNIKGSIKNTNIVYSPGFIVFVVFFRFPGCVFISWPHLLATC